MTSTQTSVHKRILEDLRDGVIVVQRGGRVAVLNTAAARILGLAHDKAIGRNFAALFVGREGFDDLTDALMGPLTGDSGTGRQVVDVRIGEQQRSLSVATSYLRSHKEGASAPSALIGVFSDITELRELRETELRMAQAVEAQHVEPQSAYRQIEERNERLATLLKRVQVARVLATVLVLGVFLGAGLYTWQPLDLFEASAEVALVEEAEAGAAEEVVTVTVRSQPIRETISLSGTLAPWRTVTVTSPIESRIAAVHFQSGQEVAEGELLVELDTAEAVREHRTAQTAHIEKQRQYDSIRKWENSPEMAAARRAFARARMSLESQEKRLKRTRFLFEQGLIAAAEREDAEQQYRSQELDFEAAKEDFAAAQARGGEEALSKAGLELRSAREEMEEIAETLKRNRIHAPLAGVVLSLSASGGVFGAGQEVGKGAALLSIGDFSRMAATATVDEVDVVRLAVGQPVSVTGNAFPELSLRGVVTHVSSQPDQARFGASGFRVVVTLDPFDGEEQQRLRAGMSSRLQIVVYQKDDALVVPIEAVERRGGKHVVRVVDGQTRETTERVVEVGPTTQRSVEVLAGLRAGEEIAISQ